MLRLNRYILALVLWLAFLFNIERLDLDIGASDVSNIATPVYIVALLMVILGIVLPQWRNVPLWRLHIIALLSFGAAAMVSTRPLWGDVQTYVTLFELTAVLISITLGYMVGRLSADFVETVRSLIFSDMNGRVYDSGQADGVIKREMQYARRGNRPLSIILLDPLQQNQSVDLRATAREIQQLLAKRQHLVSLTRLVARALRRTDFVLDQTHEGRLILVMPETQRNQVGVIINRLDERARNRLGIGVRYGVASFPEQGVTFEELVAQAEQSLRPDTSERRADMLEEQVASITEKLPVVETVTPVGVGTDG